MNIRYRSIITFVLNYPGAQPVNPYSLKTLLQRTFWRFWANRSQLGLQLRSCIATSSDLMIYSMNTNVIEEVDRQHNYIGDKSWCMSPMFIWCPMCMAKAFGSKCPTTLVSISLVLVFGSLCSFFHFILLFWNHILICRSDRTKVCAISILLRRVRYLKRKWNCLQNQPCHEIMALFVPYKLSQTRMRSRPVGTRCLIFWSEPSSTFILHVCEQRRLWRDCANAQGRLSLRSSPMW